MEHLRSLFVSVGLKLACVVIVISRVSRIYGNHRPNAEWFGLESEVHICWGGSKLVIRPFAIRRTLGISRQLVKEGTLRFHNRFARVVFWGNTDPEAILSLVCVAWNVRVFLCRILLDNWVWLLRSASFSRDKVVCESKADVLLACDRF